MEELKIWRHVPVHQGVFETYIQNMPVQLRVELSEDYMQPNRQELTLQTETAFGIERVIITKQDKRMQLKYSAGNLPAYPEIIREVLLKHRTLFTSEYITPFVPGLNTFLDSYELEVTH